MKWGEIVALALRDAGIGGMGQAPNAQMQQDALLRLQMMFDRWRDDSLVVYRLEDLSTPCVPNQLSYTLGPGGDFNIAVRPELIDGAYIRQVQPTPVDFPLAILQSREDYARIRLKTMNAAPSSVVWYDPAYPVGAVYPWPVPNSTTWELHVLARMVLDGPIALTDDVLLPPRYYDAIYWNLMVEFGNAYRRPPTRITVAKAAGTLRAVKRKNVRIPIARMPAGIRRGPAYNPYSDQGR